MFFWEESKDPPPAPQAPDPCSLAGTLQNTVNVLLDKPRARVTLRECLISTKLKTKRRNGSETKQNAGSKYM